MNERLERIRQQTSRIEQLLDVESWQEALTLSQQRQILIEEIFSEDLSTDADLTRVVMQEVLDSNSRLGDAAQNKMRMLSHQVIDLKKTFAQTQAYQDISNLR